jgi:hypothetical protein
MDGWTQKNQCILKTVVKEGQIITVYVRMHYNYNLYASLQKTSQPLEQTVQSRPVVYCYP